MSANQCLLDSMSQEGTIGQYWEGYWRSTTWRIQHIRNNQSCCSSRSSVIHHEMLHPNQQRPILWQHHRPPPHPSRNPTENNHQAMKMAPAATSSTSSTPPLATSTIGWQNRRFEYQNRQWNQSQKILF
jgi:hypothetical protein